MKQSIAIRMGQGLAMTPALQQAIKLLQMSSLDLQTEIQEVLDSNLMLERNEDSEGPSLEEALGQSEPGQGDSSETSSSKDERDAASEETPVDRQELDVEWDVYDGSSHRDAQAESELYDFRQANLHNSTTLAEHLAWQANLAGFSALQAEIAPHLLDAIDERGYIPDWDALNERLQAEHGCSADAVEETLHIIQDFDPPGIAARDLAECLQLQLGQLSDTAVRDTAEEVVTHHMELLARRDVNALARAVQVDPEFMDEVLELIQTLQPHPGQPYQDHSSEYVAPDVLVAKRSGRWKVSLNPDIAPKVRINASYMNLVKRADKSEEQQTLKQHLQEARYFINSLRSRNETLLRVAECIVEEQRAFLDYGDEAMRPLVLRDIAERLGVHESTVSRATASKYMLTPRGLYELKYFFSSSVRTTEGGSCSATAIQAMIRRLIGQETPGKPLSDNAIADLLLKEGVRVARRTVAKYREAMGISPAHVRRRMV